MSGAVDLAQSLQDQEGVEFMGHRHETLLADAVIDQRVRFHAIQPIIGLLAQFFAEHLVEVGAGRVGFVGCFVSGVFVAVHRAARDGRGHSQLKMIFPAENPPYVVRRKIQTQL